MPTLLESYKIFIASPGGLGKERVAFRDIVEEHNKSEGYDKGVHFHPVGWEDTLGGVGRPQGIINLEIVKCDYFILMLHDRWGSRPSNNSEYTSGTEEEFHIAIKALNNPNMPMRQVVLLFKDVSPSQMSDPGPQLSQVLAFRKEREEKKDLLFTTFDSDIKFTRIIMGHLSRWRREHEQNNQEKKKVIDSSITTNFKLNDFSWINQNIATENWGSAIEHAHELYRIGKILEADLVYSQLFYRSDDPNYAVEYGKFLRKQYKLHHAEEVLRKGIEMAENAKNKKCLAYATRQLGRVFEYQGKISKALDEFQKAYLIYDELGSVEGLARTHMDMGFALSKDNKPDLAIQHLKKALEKFQSINNKVGVGETYSYLGLVYKDKGEFNTSEEHHLKALDYLTSDAEMNVHAIAITKSNLGVVKRLKNEYDEAERYHREALAIYERSSDLRAIGREYSNLGVIFRRTKKYDDAILMHQKALELEEETLNEKGKGIQLSNLGLIYLDLNEIDKSEVYLNQALKISVVLNDERSQALQFKHLGKLDILRGEYELAEKHLNKSLRIDVDGKNRFGEAESRRILGDIYRFKKNPDFMKSYKNALRIYRELSLTNQIKDLELQIHEIETKNS